MSHELEIIRLRKELAEYSRRSFNRGLVSGTGGNLSVRIPGTDNALITPTGVCLGDIEPEINLLMKIDGAIIENPCGLRPSKETAFHLAVYQLRPEAGAVSHVHPPYATAYSNVVERLPHGHGFGPGRPEGGSPHRKRDVGFRQSSTSMSRRVS